MKAYIINLERSVERRNYMEHLIDKLPYFDCEFLDAVDGAKLSEKEKGRLFDKKRFCRLYARDPSAGEIGCALSHQKVYKSVIEGEDKFAFVLEDDVTIKRDIQREIEVLEPLYNTDKPVVILFSGWFWYTRKMNYQNIKIARIWDGFLAQAYLINKAAAGKLHDEYPYLLPDDWRRLAARGVYVVGVIPHAFDQLWTKDFASTIDHHNPIKDISIWQGLRIILREGGGKLLRMTGHFESCDFLERKVSDEKKTIS